METPSTTQDSAHPAAVDQRRSFGERLSSDLRLLPVAAGLIVLFVFFATQSDVFLTSRNLNNLLVQSTVTGIVALGLVFVLLVGEIDLSVAATSGVASVLMSKLVIDAGMPVPAAVALGTLSGVVIGAASGRWVTLMGVPSFVVTLGVGLVLNGIQLVLLPRTGRYNLLNSGVEKIAATNIAGASAWALLIIGLILFAAVRLSTLAARRRAGLTASAVQIIVLPLVIVGGLGTATLLILAQRNGLPMPLILYIGILGVTGYVTTETRFGLYLYAIGNNIEAARRSGIKVERIKITAFAITGGLSAFAGILAASRILGVSVSSGGGIGGGALLLESIAAAVIGGVSLFGGRGRVTGALFGALIIATVSNGLNLMGVANEARLIVTGLLLVIAVSVDRTIEKLAGGAQG